MNDNPIPGVDQTVPPQNAVSVYSQDAMDDFPVLKAFQQYIDAEQAKARKRVLSLGIFFGILTGAIIAVFVALLMNMTMRNQQLNDRLVEYAMKDRDRPPVVVQPAPQSDNSAFFASLVAKLEALQGKIAEGQAKKTEETAKPAAEAPKAAAPEKSSAEAKEIERLRALLMAEREKAAVEKERLRQAELEAYRRKHYPEYYRKLEQQRAEPEPRPVVRPRREKTPDEEIEDILKEADKDDKYEAITYFDDDKTETKPKPAAREKPTAKPKPAEEEKPAAAEKPAEPAYSIPVDVKKTPRRTWRLPAE